MKIFAHRGANTEAPENSFEAFEKAIEAGADRIEFDVRLSRDDVAIVIHDETLERTAKLNEKVSALSAAEISRLRLENGEAVPILDDVIKKFLPRIRLNIELKGTDHNLAKNVGSLVKKSSKRDGVIVSAKCVPLLVAISKDFPEVTLALVIDPAEYTNITDQDIVDLMNSGNMTIIHPRVGMIDKNFMQLATNHGWVVNCWAALVGDEGSEREQLWQKIHAFGVNAFITNHPRQFTKWQKGVGDG